MWGTFFDVEGSVSEKRSDEEKLPRLLSSIFIVTLFLVFSWPLLF